MLRSKVRGQIAEVKFSVTKAGQKPVENRVPGFHLCNLTSAIDMSRLRLTKLVLFLAALIPLGRLAWKALHGGLGANPIEVITHSTGDWTLILVLTTLSITPLRQLTRQYWLIEIGRMIGVFAFFYGTLHFLTYIWLDKFFAVHEMLKDIAKRPFITVGFSAFVLMIPLALTSTDR